MIRPKKEDKELYFIALVPEEPVYSEIWRYKEEIRDRFASKAALRSPPHITLHMPFKWSSKKEALLGLTLQAVADAQAPFILTLNNFAAFEPRVIYVDVEESEELTALQKTIAKKAASEWHLYPETGSRPFRPHMTIAFRDLKKPQFYAAWQEFKERSYENTMPVGKICLLKHNGKHWVEDQHFVLNKKVQH